MSGHRTLFTLFCWLSVGLLAAIVSQPLLGFPPKGDDLLLHFYRIPAINALWQQGIIYSRWLPDLVLGYGSPLFNFYPPLSAYLLAFAYWLVGANAPIGLNLAFGLTLVAAAVGMFLLGRDLFGNISGVFAAAAYVLSPHLLYQTFARSSISNALAMAIFPLALLTLLRVARQPAARRIAVTAVLFAAVLLSHTVASLLFAVPLAVMGITAALTPGPNHPKIARRLGAVGLAWVLGLALSAFAWLPAVTEFKFTRYETNVAAYKVDYSNYFADVWQWPEPAIVGLSNAPLPKTVGLGQLVLGVVATGLGLITLLSWARRRQRPLPHTHVLVTLGGLIALGTLFLGTPLSSWVWENVASLHNLQFPWRLLDIPTFFLALTCGWLVSYFDGRFWWRMGLVAAGVIVFFANALPYLYPPRLETLPKRPALTDATQAQQQYQIYGLTGWGEYSSSAVSAWPAAPPFPGADSGASLDMKLQRANLPDGALLAAEGGPLRARLQVALPTDTTIVFNSHYFPGWAATIDGRPAPVGPDEVGRLQLAVPAGAHTVVVYFGRTPVRWLADGLSLLAAIMVGLGLVQPFARWRSQETAVRPPPPATSNRQQLLGMAGIAGLLLLLALSKFIWLDRFNSPLVIHPDGDQIPGVTAPVWGDFDGVIRLVGYKVSDPDQLTLYWQAQRSPTQIYRVAVILVDARGLPVQTILNDYPGYNVTSTWGTGQLTRDVYLLPVEPEKRPVGYRLSVAILDPNTNQPLPLIDSPGGAAEAAPVGTVKIAPASTVAAAGAKSIEMIFGGAIELSHVSLPATVSRGQPLDISLWWRSLAPVTEDYTLFVHLLQPDGTFVAANDGQPLDGLYPTSFWAPGEVILDKRPQLLTLPPGRYLIQVGLYRLATGERLPVAGHNATLGDRVIIGEVEVVP